MTEKETCSLPAFLLGPGAEAPYSLDCMWPLAACLEAKATPEMTTTPTPSRLQFPGPERPPTPPHPHPALPQVSVEWPWGRKAWWPSPSLFPCPRGCG